jgi:hypothetical protein
MISSFSLKYVDEEGDQISLCSNLELLEALRQIDERKEKLLKIYINEETLNFVTPIQPPKPVVIPVKEPVNIKPPQSNSFSNSDNLTHKNIFCNSCKIEIIGTRWKCSMCPLNLCELCEPWDNHNQSHPLLRIRHPISPTMNCAYMTISNFHQFGEQVNRYLSSPQVSEISTQAKKIGEEVAGKIKRVTDQVLTQTKDIRQEISTVITKEANSFVEMCNALNEELTKTCRYSNPPRQQQNQNQRAQAKPAPRATSNIKPNPTQSVPAPVVQSVVKPEPIPVPVPVVAAPVSAPVVDESEYSYEKTVLRQMGFTDEVKNSELLKKYRGDLNECLNTLCQL